MSTKTFYKVPKFLFYTLSFTFLFFLSIFYHVKLQSYAQSTSSFIFTAAGDYGADGNAPQVLTAMNPLSSSSNFNLALGDLNYAELSPESAWCDFVKNNVGQDFPFELIAGNHEDNDPSPNSIDNFAACLPDRVGNITGVYAKEYFFDYPQASPLARIIMIAADLNIDGGLYSYTSGTTHYNWLVQAIDSARASGIRWIVVGMHKNCTTMGIKNCAISTDLQNLLVDKKVDLILQGHDHNYQRSKQLSLGPLCPGIAESVYNPDCVVDDGADNQYIKGTGSVLAIVGTGGASLTDVSTADPESGYFAKWSGSNDQPTWGFLKVYATDTQFFAQFVPVSGTFSDTFTITDSGLATPTPIPPAPTNSPTSTPPPGNITVSSQINSSSNDAEENISTGGVNINSSDLELGTDGTTNQIVGMRFTGVAIPKNATIINSYAEFEVDEVSTDAASVTFWGQAADNPVAFTTGSLNISSRPPTSSSVVWNSIPSWNTVNVKHQSPNLNSIIQEIVNRPGWNSGNSLVLTASGTGRRTAEAYDGEIPAAVKLVVTYSVGPTVTPTPTPTIDPFAPTPTETPSPTLTPVPTETPLPTPTPNVISLNPLADSYVKSSSANSNYGTRVNLSVDGSPVAITYMKFDLASLAGRSVQSAKLRIRTESDISSSAQTIKSVGSTSWTETGINYNNRPAVGSGISIFSAPTANTWYDIDITPEVVSHLGQLMSIGFDQSSSNGMFFSSRESANKPLLIVTFN